jgi:hypothetical protein
MVNRGFAAAVRNRAHLWGFYPCANMGWLKETVTVGLTFIYGCAWGVINCKDMDIMLHLKEDYERTMKFFRRDGCVVRLNDCAPVQKYLKNPGGLADFRTYEREEEECNSLVEAYPDLCKIVRKPNRIDLRLAKVTIPDGLSQT